MLIVNVHCVATCQIRFAVETHTEIIPPSSRRFDDPGVVAHLPIRRIASQERITHT